MPVVLRRLILWTIVCCVSAAPSFVLAWERHDPAAMIIGVALFITIYTAATSTAAFERFHRRPFVQRTLYIGYGLRLILSMVMPLGFVSGNPGMIVLLADGLPGLWSGVFVEEWLGVAPVTFAGTLLTTIVQGALLNVIIFVVMALVYAFQRMFVTPPPEYSPKGFDVVMPTATFAAPAAGTATRGSGS